MLDPGMAVENQRVGAPVEARDRDRVAEDVMQPAQLDRSGIDLQSGGQQSLIMAFARPYHQPVLAEGDRLVETVARHMVDG